MVSWRLSIGHRVTADPVGAAREALLAHEGAALAFMVSDFHADASRIESVLEHEVKIPVIGGLAEGGRSQPRG